MISFVHFKISKLKVIEEKIEKLLLFSVAYLFQQILTGLWKAMVIQVMPVLTLLKNVK